VRVVYCGNGSLSNATLFVSRTGVRIGAVIGYPPGAQGLATVSVSGGSLRALPVSAGTYGQVVWSQDGLWVASHPLIGSQAPGGGPPKAPLLIANTKTGTARTVLDENAAASINQLDDWSPDDRQLLVSRFVAASGSQPAHDDLQLIDVKTGQIQDLGPGGGGVFSPDGREIAFSASDGRLVLLNLASGQQTNLPVFDAGSVTWSPDGTAIAYGVGQSPIQLFVLRLGTEMPRLIGTNSVGRLTWSGKSLIWTTGSGITITDTRTGKHRTIYPLPPSFVTKSTVPPQTSPVGILPGQRIVYELPGWGYRTVSITGRNDERLLACRGKGYGDKVIGSQLNDLINVRNGTLDTVDCKAGNDFVLADHKDHVARNCETVVRR
jgi:WD40 repeat protein